MTDRCRAVFDGKECESDLPAGYGFHYPCGKAQTFCGTFNCHPFDDGTSCAEAPEAIAEAQEQARQERVGAELERLAPLCTFPGCGKPCNDVRHVHHPDEHPGGFAYLEGRHIDLANCHPFRTEEPVVDAEEVCLDCGKTRSGTTGVPGICNGWHTGVDAPSAAPRDEHQATPREGTSMSEMDGYEDILVRMGGEEPEPMNDKDTVPTFGGATPAKQIIVVMTLECEPGVAYGPFIDDDAAEAFIDERMNDPDDGYDSGSILVLKPVARS